MAMWRIHTPAPRPSPTPKRRKARRLRATRLRFDAAEWVRYWAFTAPVLPSMFSETVLPSLVIALAS